MSNESWSMVLHLSREMVRLAREQEWEAVAEHEAQRGQLLETLPSIDNTTESGVTAAMSEVVQLDKELMALCRLAQDEVVKALGALSAGRRSDAAYTKNL